MISNELLRDILNKGRKIAEEIGDRTKYVSFHLFPDKDEIEFVFFRKDGSVFFVYKKVEDLFVD